MRSVLRSVWNEPRPGNAPRRAGRDWAIAGVFAVAVLLQGALTPHLPWRVFTVVIALVLLPAVVWRRQQPLAMLAVVFVVTGVASPIIGGEPRLSAMVYILFLPYALFRWGSGREIVAGSALVLVKLAYSLAFPDFALSDAAAGLAVLAALSAAGLALRYRARARDREFGQIKLLERERLARDLHDTVAHHVSAMAIRAQAGIATAAVKPEAAVEALTLIEEEAKRALAEMRSMVRVLRQDEPAEYAPAPRVTDLSRLAGRTDAGPAIDVRISGQTDELPPAVGTAIYRLAQEAVTNARRHARHATRIEVRVAADAEAVRLLVTDDGESSPLRNAAPTGYGLVGMAERAALLGGNCEAGPAPGRGWTVSAVLPRGGA
jgi:signal transduction histidine kinase